VAPGVVRRAVGSDGAGSIRIPAAWSHLVGIKPAGARLPDPEASRITEWGPLARTTADAALLLGRAGRRDPVPRGGRTRAPGGCGSRCRCGRRRRCCRGRRWTRPCGRRLSGVARQLVSLGHELVVDDPDYGLIVLNFLPASLAGVHAWLHGGAGLGAAGLPHEGHRPARCTPRRPGC